MVARVMISGTWRPMAEALAILNHPGHSSQKSHGRKGAGGPGAGRDLIATREEAEALAQKVYAAADELQYGPHGDEFLHHIGAEQGFDAPATVVSGAEMDAARAQGQGLYRGVKASRDGTKTAEEIHDQMADGEPYYGAGVAGNGTYMTSRQVEAAGYGTVRGFALHRDARVVDEDTMRADQKEFLSGLDRDSVAYGIFQDRGRFAAARGYDAYDWSFTEADGSVTRRVVVLNRSALLMEEA